VSKGTIHTKPPNTRDKNQNKQITIFKLFHPCQEQITNTYYKQQEVVKRRAHSRVRKPKNVQLINKVQQDKLKLARSKFRSILKEPTAIE